MALAASLALHAQAVDNPAANNKADNGQRNTTENAFVFTARIIRREFWFVKGNREKIIKKI